MPKVILFDLDGTLLPMDTHGFIQHYIKELSIRVAHIINPAEFVPALLSGTQAMLQDVNGSKTNEEVFEEVFLSMTKLKKEEIWPTLEQFYETDFPNFSHLSEPTPLAREVIEEAVRKGYRVAIATNPVFPRVAIHHRLRWAGVEDLPLELVTVYEESLYTKPHPEYYQEICNRLGVQPDDCVMVGNHLQEDMVAASIGMKTFLVEGYVMDKGNQSYPIDDRGTLEELLQKLMNEEGIFTK